MRIHSVTALKSRSSELLQRVVETRTPVLITQKGQPKAVLQDLQSYEDTRRSLAMLKLMLQAEGDVQRGRVRSQAAVRTRLRRSR